MFRCFARLHRCALATMISLWLHQARPGSSSASFGYRFNCLWSVVSVSRSCPSCCTIYFLLIFVAAHTYVHSFVFFHLSRSSGQKMRTKIPLASSHGDQMRSKQNNQRFYIHLTLLALGFYVMLVRYARL